MGEAKKRGRPKGSKGQQRNPKVKLEQASNPDPERLRRAINLLISEEDILDYLRPKRPSGSRDRPTGQLRLF